MPKEKLTETRNEDGSIPPEMVWAYYADAAGKRWRKGSPYSMQWYYDDHGELMELNRLTKAFLGDGKAMAGLNWDEPLEFQPKDCCLEDSGLNDSQEDAIRTALTQPISFIKGPPGTGKTQVILHLASCIAANGKTAAIVSCNNAALENIHEKARGLSDDGTNLGQLKSKLARLGNGGNIAEFVLGHQTGNLVQETYEFRGFKAAERKEIELNNDRIGYFPERVKKKYEEKSQKKVKKEELSEEEKKALPAWMRYEVKKKPAAEAFLKDCPIITSTVHSLQKCFSDGKSYVYDYVIIDETSQLDVLVGLTAMGCAEHLVLVGDSDQLPPVMNEQEVKRLNQSGLAVQIESITNSKGEPIYLLNEKRSFLDICMDIFDHGRDPIVPQKIRVMLNVHYRCHRGIFQFCKEAIYDPQAAEEGEKIVIDTPPKNYLRTIDYKCPIKVLWFEGDYCEPGWKDKEKTQSSKLNRRQIVIFIEEEMEYLYHYLKENDKGSVCILSPFKGQLLTLETAINQWCESRGVQLKVQQSDEAKNAADAPGSSEPAFLTVGLSTVHKSQGQEYDIVYLLPVEDTDWEWPWSQQKRLVNVAVSRAVQELRIITSSALMEEAIQKGLPETKGRWIEPRHKLSENERGKREPEEMYIQKLVTYVQKQNIPKGGPYGFHQTQLCSVFDQAAFIRSERRAGREAGSQSAPEACLRNALREMPLFKEKKLRICSEVFISDILPPEKVIDQDLSDYVKNGARFDFVVCDEAGRVLLVVEVDGDQHRHHRYWEQEFINKNGEHMTGFRKWIEQNHQERLKELLRIFGRGKGKNSLELSERIRELLTQWAITEKLKEQEAEDEKKNRLVTEVFRAALYRGNRRENRPENEVVAFAFLRLPTDGSTCLEVRTLWKKAGPSLRGKYFTMEDLIETQLEYLKHAPEEGIWRYQEQRRA